MLTNDFDVRGKKHQSTKKKTSYFVALCQSELVHNHSLLLIAMLHTDTFNKTSDFNMQKPENT